MSELNKKSWKDFDYHREKMAGVFSKIKNIKWIEVDNDVYNKLKYHSDTNEHPLLECSRYSHHKYEKCYPSFDDCYECFKYWCGDCSKGSNSMYFSCNGKRCTRFFENIPMIFEVKSIKKRIYIFKNNNDWFSDTKKILRDREMYGF